MGVYIKGMEMPKEIDPSITIEFATELSGKLYARYHDYNSGGSTEWHKVMTIPELHGRLIDADKLLKLLDSCMFPSDMVTTRALSMATNWLREAQTVIPADKDGET